MQLRLNISFIFHEDRFIDLGMWEEISCKYCGEQLSLPHALVECINQKHNVLPGQNNTPCTNQAIYLQFLSDLSNIKQTPLSYKNIYLSVRNTIENYI